MSMTEETIVLIKKANEKINEAIGTLEREMDSTTSNEVGLYDFIRNFDLYEKKLEELINGKE